MPNPLIGILMKVASTAFFAVTMALVKLVSERLPLGEVVFARSLLGIVPLLVWLALRRELPVALKTKAPFSHVLRAFAGTVSMFFWFGSLARLPLPDVTAINYAAPLMTTALAALLLGEQVRAYRWTAVIVGFLGVLLVLGQHMSDLSHLSGDGESIGALMAFFSAVFAALAMISIRRMSGTEHTGAIVFYFMISASGIALLTAPFGWVMPTPHEWGLLAAIGLFGGLGQVLLTQSYRYAEASVIAPFTTSTCCG
ncbi:DMT family transporter [Methylobrevis pamukkalensis]|uniref:DMT family transporter n=1 Tax=Methylobrevis pamukkalensis TaxID=1439726 RepID=UPI00315A9126